MPTLKERAELAAKLSEDDTMSEMVVVVGEFKGVPIEYDKSRRQFVATVKVKEEEHEIRKRSQADLEKALLKLIDPEQRTKAIKIGYEQAVEVIEILRRSEKRYNGEWEYIGEDGRRRKSGFHDVYVWTDVLEGQLKNLRQERDMFLEDWERRWGAVTKKAKEMKPELLK